MGSQSAPDLAIAALADAQYGVVARRQLLEWGLTAREIQRRVAARRLRAVYRGVYAVGHQRLTAEGRWLAAVLAGGPGAVLSHASAAAAWDLRPSSGIIHVTVPTRAGRERRAGLRIHRCALTPAETTVHRDIPITTATRTIVDLSRSLSGRRLEALIDRADLLRLTDFAALRSARSASLRAALSNYDPAPTRSELEEAFLRLCDDHGIPRPETNTRIEGMEVDFVWRDPEADRRGRRLRLPPVAEGLRGGP
jgi:predicted transcriptional regulator of viral defense system